MTPQKNGVALSFNAAWARRYGGDFDLAVRYFEKMFKKHRDKKVTREFWGAVSVGAVFVLPMLFVLLGAMSGKGIKALVVKQSYEIGGILGLQETSIEFILAAIVIICLGVLFAVCQKVGRAIILFVKGLGRIIISVLSTLGIPRYLDVIGEFIVKKAKNALFLFKRYLACLII